MASRPSRNCAWARRGLRSARRQQHAPRPVEGLLLDLIAREREVRLLGGRVERLSAFSSSALRLGYFFCARSNSARAMVRVRADRAQARRRAAPPRPRPRARPCGRATGRAASEEGGVRIALDRLLDGGDGVLVPAGLHQVLRDRVVVVRLGVGVGRGGAHGGRGVIGAAGDIAARRRAACDGRSRRARRAGGTGESSLCCTSYGVGESARPRQQPPRGRRERGVTDDGGRVVDVAQIAGREGQRARRRAPGNRIHARRAEPDAHGADHGATVRIRVASSVWRRVSSWSQGELSTTTREAAVARPVADAPRNVAAHDSGPGRPELVLESRSPSCGSASGADRESPAGRRAVHGYSAPYSPPAKSSRLWPIDSLQAAPYISVSYAKTPPRRRLTLSIDDLAFGGEGVGRVDGYVVFVRGGLPGDRLTVRVTEARARYGRAPIEAVESPRPTGWRRRASYFGRCGGCRLQHLAYPAQLAFKEKQVRDCLERLGGLRPFELRPILPAPEAYGYRNKMEFTVAGTRTRPDRPAPGGPLRRRARHRALPAAVGAR